MGGPMGMGMGGPRPGMGGPPPGAPTGGPGAGMPPGIPMGLGGGGKPGGGMAGPGMMPGMPPGGGVRPPMMSSRQSSDENLTSNPASEQVGQRDIRKERDVARVWVDEDDSPLKVGREYEMASPAYDIPDIVRIIAIKPESIEFEITSEFGLNHKTELTVQDAKIEGITFTEYKHNEEMSDDPEEGGGDAVRNDATSGDQTDLSNVHITARVASGGDLHEAIQVAKSLLMDDPIDVFTDAKSLDEAVAEAADMYGITDPESIEIIRHYADETKKDAESEPALWEGPYEEDQNSQRPTLGSTKEAIAPSEDILFPPCKYCDQVAGFTPYAFAKGMMSCDNCGITQPVSEIADQYNSMMEDNRLGIEGYGDTQKDIQSLPTTEHPLGPQTGSSKEAGAKFAPMQQKEFIDEQGTARNADKLDLSNTHYTSTDQSEDDFFLWL